ncbi:MAG: hypothetical protein IJS65_06605, partial [Clostridia bacterium]|nr:hypothetical protein [Clostridia bacterium]
GGYSFRALYTIPIISGKKDKNRLISEIMDKYGSGKNDYIPLGDTVFDDCEIKEITNVFSMLSISASFMTTDDKHPGEYCYDWLLKGFINKIDESSLIWNN